MGNSEFHDMPRVFGNNEVGSWYLQQEKTLQKMQRRMVFVLNSPTDISIGCLACSAQHSSQTIQFSSLLPCVFLPGRSAIRAWLKTIEPSASIVSGTDNCLIWKQSGWTLTLTHTGGHTRGWTLANSANSHTFRACLDGGRVQVQVQVRLGPH